MVEIKKIYESSDLAIIGGKYGSERFSSLADTVTVKLRVICNSADGASFTLVSYDKEGQPTDIHTEKTNAKISEIAECEYSFDPISLAVYKNATEFSLRLTGVSKIISLEVFESVPDSGADDSDARDNTGVDENGAPIVYVKSIDGEKISVPRVPSKVLFIGNSLVFGMGGYGMCSSAPDKDYYHYVTEHILKFNPDCKFDKLYGSFFEHSENIEMFDNWYYNDCGLKKIPPIPAASKFTADTDLIFIQLGDNVNTDAKEAAFLVTKDILLERIKRACPKARIIWIHGWYNRSRTDKPIKEICESYELERIDISSLRSKVNEAHTQKYYYNISEQKLCEVKEAWITHPGDLGMKRIAEKIIEKLKLC